MGIVPRKQRKQKIGVSKQQDNLYFVWLDEFYKVQSICLNGQQKDIFPQLLSHLSQKANQCCFIGSISPHLTWSKTLILPQTLNAQECEQQCRFILQKELPIPLDELWFDYLSMPLKQGFRLDITAIRQESANAELEKYLPLELTALDLLNHSILRAFYAILGQEPINTLFLYQDQQGCLAVCERLQQRQVLQSQGHLSELYQQFTHRFPETIEQIYVYQTPDILNSHTIGLLPQDWQRIETDLPFIALGNALWQTDLKLVDLSLKSPALLPSINRESGDV
ncbi:competence protein ComA [Haemophilus parainfluenzae]|uniref:competence protein ComA n=1 Tax=Haemophilus parainfluenzae TaxID=729 RepID=UPI0018A4E759|nr:competence protein ComA [Haemophilus parainfluenzae]QOR25348.1 competence protein ComA [Haemophilus parainfluenzae]